ncbi:hypothetical protein HDU97_004319 [Phlyctochytrium planicorne]|nr:hypothetical protein HDU97_004319 [Phlyctochytrium planicorne]
MTLDEGKTFKPKSFLWDEADTDEESMDYGAVPSDREGMSPPQRDGRIVAVGNNGDQTPKAGSPGQDMTPRPSPRKQQDQRLQSNRASPIPKKTIAETQTTPAAVKGIVTETQTSPALTRPFEKPPSRAGVASNSSRPTPQVLRNSSAETQTTPKLKPIPSVNNTVSGTQTTPKPKPASVKNSVVETQTSPKKATPTVKNSAAETQTTPKPKSSSSGTQLTPKPAVIARNSIGETQTTPVPASTAKITIAETQTTPKLATDPAANIVAVQVQTEKNAFVEVQAVAAPNLSVERSFDKPPLHSRQSSQANKSKIPISGKSIRVQETLSVRKEKNHEILEKPAVVSDPKVEKIEKVDVKEEDIILPQKSESLPLPANQDNGGINNNAPQTAPPPVDTSSISTQPLNKILTENLNSLSSLQTHLQSLTSRYFQHHTSLIDEQGEAMHRQTVKMMRNFHGLNEEHLDLQMRSAKKVKQFEDEVRRLDRRRNNANTRRDNFPSSSNAFDEDMPVPFREPPLPVPRFSSTSEKNAKVVKMAPLPPSLQKTQPKVEITPPIPSPPLEQPVLPPTQLPATPPLPPALKFEEAAIKIGRRMALMLSPQPTSPVRIASLQILDLPEPSGFDYASVRKAMDDLQKRRQRIEEDLEKDLGGGDNEFEAVDVVEGRGDEGEEEGERIKRVVAKRVKEVSGKFGEKLKVPGHGEKAGGDGVRTEVVEDVISISYPVQQQPQKASAPVALPTTGVKRPIPSARRPPLATNRRPISSLSLRESGPFKPPPLKQPSRVPSPTRSSPTRPGSPVKPLASPERVKIQEVKELRRYVVGELPRMPDLETLVLEKMAGAGKSGNGKKEKKVSKSEKILKTKAQRSTRIQNRVERLEEAPAVVPSETARTRPLEVRRSQSTPAPDVRRGPSPPRIPTAARVPAATMVPSSTRIPSPTRLPSPTRVATTLQWKPVQPEDRFKNFSGMQFSPSRGRREVDTRNEGVQTGPIMVGTGVQVDEWSGEKRNVSVVETIVPKQDVTESKDVPVEVKETGVQYVAPKAKQDAAVQFTSTNATSVYFSFSFDSELTVFQNDTSHDTSSLSLSISTPIVYVSKSKKPKSSHQPRRKSMDREDIVAMIRSGQFRLPMNRNSDVQSRIQEWVRSEVLTRLVARQQQQQQQQPEASPTKPAQPTSSNLGLSTEPQQKSSDSPQRSESPQRQTAEDAVAEAEADTAMAILDEVFKWETRTVSAEVLRDARSQAEKAAAESAAKAAIAASSSETREGSIKKMDLEEHSRLLMTEMKRMMDREREERRKESEELMKIRRKEEKDRMRREVDELRAKLEAERKDGGDDGRVAMLLERLRAVEAERDRVSMESLVKERMAEIERGSMERLDRLERRDDEEEERRRRRERERREREMQERERKIREEVEMERRRQKEEMEEERRRREEEQDPLAGKKMTRIMVTNVATQSTPLPPEPTSTSTGGPSHSTSITDPPTIGSSDSSSVGLTTLSTMLSEGEIVTHFFSEGEVITNMGDRPLFRMLRERDRDGTSRDGSSLEEVEVRGGGEKKADSSGEKSGSKSGSSGKSGTTSSGELTSLGEISKLEILEEMSEGEVEVKRSKRSSKRPGKEHSNSPEKNTRKPTAEVGGPSAAGPSRPLYQTAEASKERLQALSDKKAESSSPIATPPIIVSAPAKTIQVNVQQLHDSSAAATPPASHSPQLKPVKNAGTIAEPPIIITGHEAQPPMVSAQSIEDLASSFGGGGASSSIEVVRLDVGGGGGRLDKGKGKVGEILSVEEEGSLRTSDVGSLSSMHSAVAGESGGTQGQVFLKKEGSPALEGQAQQTHSLKALPSIQPHHAVPFQQQHPQHQQQQQQPLLSAPAQFPNPLSRQASDVTSEISDGLSGFSDMIRTPDESRSPTAEPFSISAMLLGKQHTLKPKKKMAASRAAEEASLLLKRASVVTDDERGSSRSSTGDAVSSVESLGSLRKRVEEGASGRRRLIPDPKDVLGSEDEEEEEEEDRRTQRRSRGSVTGLMAFPELSPISSVSARSGPTLSPHDSNSGSGSKRSGGSSRSGNGYDTDSSPASVSASMSGGGDSSGRSHRGRGKGDERDEIKTPSKSGGSYSDDFSSLTVSSDR